MRIILIILSILAITSCGSQRHIASSIDQKDSLSVKTENSVIWVDSLIQAPLPLESESVRIPDSDTSHLETSAAESDAWIADGQLHHTLRNKETSIPILVKLPQYVSSTTSEKYLLKTEIKTVEVPRDFTKWQSFLMVTGKLALAAIALLVVGKIIKKKSFF